MANRRSALQRLPNILSFSRLLIAAGFVVADTGAVRVGLLGVAGATDFLDGWLARRVNAASRWGALIDPIADRFFVLTAVSTLLFNGSLDTAGYFILISRDLATAIGFLVARMVPWLKPVEFKARWLGKVVTVFQLLTLAAVMVAPRFEIPLLAVVAVLSAWSIVDYTLALWRGRAR